MPGTKSTESEPLFPKPSEASASPIPSFEAGTTPEAEPVKRGRGRPKGSTNKKKAEVVAAAAVEPVKRGRGRPKGSTNKKAKVKAKAKIKVKAPAKKITLKVKGKRGRPAKVNGVFGAAIEQARAKIKAMTAQYQDLEKQIVKSTAYLAKMENFAEEAAGHLGL